MAGAVTEGEGTPDTWEQKKFDAKYKLKEEELKLRREEMIRQDRQDEIRREERRQKDEELKLRREQIEISKDKERRKEIEKQQNDRDNNKKQISEQRNAAASTIKHLMEPCPSNLREVPAYFRKIERIFDSHNIEWEHRADLLTRR